MPYRQKTGEYPGFRGQIYLDDRHLVPVISDSYMSRAQFGTLYVREGACVQNGTLIYAGGDHNISPSHTGLCLAVELALQKQGIAYDVSRGTDAREDANLDFDGVALQAPGHFFRAVEYHHSQEFDQD